MIVSYAVEPKRHIRPELEDVLQSLCSSPLIRVNRLWRASTIDVAAYDRLWIETRSNSVKYNKILGLVNEVSPVVDPFFEDLLPADKPTLTFTLGRDTDASQKTRNFAKLRTRIIYPFNYQSFLYLMNLVRDTSTKTERLDCITIKCSPLPAKLLDLMQRQIAPAITFALGGGRQDMECSVPFLRKVENLVGDGGLHDIRPVFSVWKSIYYASKEISILLNGGHFEQAGLFALHAGQQLLNDASKTFSWPWGWLKLRLAMPGYRSDPEVILRMAGVCMLHEIERHAHRFYLVLVKNKEWRNAHSCNLTNHGSRWITPPTFSWFGLMDAQLADCHHMAAQAIFEQTRVLREIVRAGAASEHRREDIKDNLGMALTHCKFAGKLNSTKYTPVQFSFVQTDFAKILRQCGVDARQSEDVHDVDDGVGIEYMDVDGDRALFRGDLTTILLDNHSPPRWRNDILRHLPRAQQIVSDVMLRPNIYWRPLTSHLKSYANL